MGRSVNPILASAVGAADDSKRNSFNGPHASIAVIRTASSNLASLSLAGIVGECDDIVEVVSEDSLKNSSSEQERFLQGGRLCTAWALDLPGQEDEP